jgi:hypothetical protein
MTLGFIAICAASSSPSRSQQRGRQSRSGTCTSSRDHSWIRTPSRPLSRGPPKDMNVPLARHRAIRRSKSAGGRRCWTLPPRRGPSRHPCVDGGGLSDSEVCHLFPQPIGHDEMLTLHSLPLRRLRLPPRPQHTAVLVAMCTPAQLVDEQ